MFQFHKNLRQILLIFLSTLIISNANANNYPEGYPECWKDSENPINTSVVPLDVNKIIWDRLKIYFYLKTLK